ncbi:MAG: hypothetical protein L7S57_04615 [Luminiphilus sp.]|nr:hypothetical protein [Luminiphilus sp.]
MSFLSRYGLGMEQQGGLDLQAQDPRMQAAAPRMITASPGAQGAGVGSYNDLEQALANSGIAPSAAAATIPINPGASGGGVSPAAPTGSPAPISTGSPAVINGSTGAVEPPAIAPTSIPMPEGVTRRDRLMAGFSMMAAAGTADFSRVAAGVNVGLIEKEKNAEKARQSLMALTKPNIEYGQIGDVQIRKIYDPAYKYDPQASEIQEIPGSDLKGPQIEQWTKDGWVTYDPSGAAAKDRETIKLADGVTYYKDTLGNEGGPQPVDQAQFDRANRDRGRGNLTAKDAAAKLGEEGQMLKDMLPNYMTLDKTLANENNPFADVATLFAFMKTADPGSVVRPSEGEMFSSAGSLSTELANALNGVITGKSLTKEQQSQLRVVVDDIMIGHVQRTEQARANWEDFFTQDAQAADGWDVNILNPYDALYGSDIPTQIRGRIANRGQAQTPPPPPGNLEEQAEELLKINNRFGNRAGR